MANTMTFVEPLFSSQSLLFGVLVCISVRPGFSMVDREALKMTTYMMSTYHGLSQSQEGRTVGSGVGGVEEAAEIRLSGTGDTFVASFAPRGRKKVEIAVRDLVAGTEPKNVGALADPNAFDEYREFAKNGL